jgi:hypothetical protein
VWVADPVGSKARVTPSWSSIHPSFLPGFPRAGAFSQRMQIIRSALLLLISLYRSEFFDGGEFEFSYMESPCFNPVRCWVSSLTCLLSSGSCQPGARYDVLRRSP